MIEKTDGRIGIIGKDNDHNFKKNETVLQGQKI